MRNIINDALIRDLFNKPTYEDHLEKLCGGSTDGIGDYLRTKMREEGFARRLMPPQPITPEELCVQPLQQ